MTAPFVVNRLNTHGLWTVHIHHKHTHRASKSTYYTPALSEEQPQQPGGMEKCYSATIPMSLYWPSWLSIFPPQRDFEEIQLSAEWQLSHLLWALLFLKRNDSEKKLFSSYLCSTPASFQELHSLFWPNFCWWPHTSNLNGVHFPNNEGVEK